MYLRVIVAAASLLAVVLSFAPLSSLLTCRSSSCCIRVSRPPLVLLALEQNKDGSYSDNSAVAEVSAALNKLVSSLAPPSLVGAAAVDEDRLSLASVEESFGRIMADIQGSSKLTEMEKRMLYAEASLTLNDAQLGDDNALKSAEARSRRLGVSVPKTSLYSVNAAPVLIVYGPGSVGQALLSFAKGLGKGASFRFLDADQLGVVSDKELNYAVKDARSIVIAADAARKTSGGGGGWFGGGDNEDGPSFILGEKNLKKLLNAAMNERNKSPSPYEVKVVALAKATKTPKSFASFMGGDATEFDSEVILQCQQRKLPYAVIKIGQILTNDAPLPINVKSRLLKASLPTLTKEEETLALEVPSSPLVFTRSRVEASEVTRLSIAVHALLRSATHPQTNSTISVLSTVPASTSSLPSDAEWDDEFLRLEGPELERIPLQFASEAQVALRMGRIVQVLQEPSSGLVTPIEVERFANGARILFRPRESGYLSSKEEQAAEKLRQEQAVASSGGGQKKKSISGYLSPEAEAAEEEAAAKASLNTAVSAAVTNVKSKKLQNKLEGGLEIIVDSQPYRRVRIKRCNMGPQTVVKEESEALILKALLLGIRSLEREFKASMMAMAAKK